jgi:hypothetical protein
MDPVPNATAPAEEQVSAAPVAIERPVVEPVPTSSAPADALPAAMAHPVGVPDDTLSPEASVGQGTASVPSEPGRVTASQLRRFIRSRPFVPLHELRRRFELNGSADDMAAIDVDGQRMWVGLPEREGRLLGELLRGGDIGYEVSIDPVTPVIIGVYPLRTVHRS